MLHMLRDGESTHMLMKDDNKDQNDELKLYCSIYMNKEFCLVFNTFLDKLLFQRTGSDIQSCEFSSY
jgi:plasmid maintenance system killer protein